MRHCELRWAGYGAGVEIVPTRRLDQVERDRIKKALLDYCGQDTLAMVRLIEKLRQTSHRPN
jgi:hypothetical protein